MRMMSSIINLAGCLTISIIVLLLVPELEYEYESLEYD